MRGSAWSAHQEPGGRFGCRCLFSCTALRACAGNSRLLLGGVVARNSVSIVALGCTCWLGHSLSLIFGAASPRKRPLSLSLSLIAPDPLLCPTLSLEQISCGGPEPAWPSSSPDLLGLPRAACDLQVHDERRCPLWGEHHSRFAIATASTCVASVCSKLLSQVRMCVCASTSHAHLIRGV